VIGCALAGAVAGVNLGAVFLLAYLWYRGRQDLQDLLRISEDLVEETEQRSGGHVNGLSSDG